MLKLRCATNQEDDCKFQFVEDMDMEGESGDEIKVKRESYAGNYNSYELMSRQGNCTKSFILPLCHSRAGVEKIFYFLGSPKGNKKFSVINQ